VCSSDLVFVADIETKGLLDVLHSEEDFHVLSLGYKDQEGKWNIKSTNIREDVLKVFCNPANNIVMHNGRRYDKPAIEKMFGVVVTANIIDSLSLAWYLEPNRIKEGKKYGLESYGEDFGVLKPEVSDWQNLDYEEYKHRCQEDVLINIKLWEKLLAKLRLIYDEDETNSQRIVNLLNWIMDCSYMQEQQKIEVDMVKLEENLSHFESLKEEKIKQLIEAMPKKKIIKELNKPKKMFKSDGSDSALALKWYAKLEELGAGRDYPHDVVKYIDSFEDGNPDSVKQKKEWLYSLGWKPQTFKHNRNKETNEVKIVEQIMTDDKMLCPSVLKLIEVEPAIEHLDGLTVLTHRIGLLKGFRDNRDENNMIYQRLASLAVTLRFKHGTIVNLPRYTGKGDIRDGKWIRECLIAGKGKKVVQSDLSGIESRTSDHYTFHINPERIKKTQMPFFDPHCEIAVFANLMTRDEEIYYVYKSAVKDNPDLKIETFSELYQPTEEVYRLLALPKEEQGALMNKIKMQRSKGKSTNYASLYSVGAETLGRNLEISKIEAQGLIDAYWKIHFAVRVVSDSFEVKRVGNENWIFNPISRFWYYLRNEKDKFSVINQSSAVFCFNMWVWNCTRKGIWPVTQSHDDQLFVVEDNKVDETIKIIADSMRNTNKQLNLNVPLACETQVGNNVAETH
jgi:hypothetical protein